MDVERDVTVLVKTFERPDCLRRLVSSIRRYYPRIAIVVVDDSGQRLDPVPSEIATYVHEPYTSLGAAGGRNLGLRQVETPYVLVCGGTGTAGSRSRRPRAPRAPRSASAKVATTRP